MLVAHEPFQEEVRKLRARLKIGPGGNAKENPERDWVDWAEEENGRVMDSHRFIEQEKGINKAWREGKISSRQRERQMRLWYAQAPMQDLSVHVDDIIDDFGLPLNYKQAITRYVISETMSGVPSKNWEPAKVSSSKDEHRKRSLAITIYSKLAQDEIDELNDYIKWVGEKTLPQYREVENSDLMVKVKNACDAQYFDEKTGKKKKSSHADIAEEYLGSRKKAGKVREMLRMLKDHQSRRFQRRGKK